LQRYFIAIGPLMHWTHRSPRTTPPSPCALFVIACGLFLVWQPDVANAAALKVACIGEHTTHSDSFASSNRETQPVGKQEYPARLQTLLGSKYDVRNFGDCCATILQGYTPSETHPYVLGSLGGRGPGYTESLAFLPDIVVIGSWGRHDWGKAKNGSAVFTVGAFQKNYDDLVQRYMKLASHPKIYVSLPIPILFGQGDVPDNGVTTLSVVPAVEAVATKYNLPVIDLYKPFLGHKELFKEEGEHVTDGPGLDLIAQTVYAALTQTNIADAGIVDAGRVPAAPRDAAAPMGAGGARPALPDASAAARAGSGGASSAADANTGLSGSGPTQSKSGCGCSTIQGSVPPASLALLGGAGMALVIARRRTRKGAPSSS
jgi:hypothetical protein